MAQGWRRRIGRARIGRKPGSYQRFASTTSRFVIPWQHHTLSQYHTAHSTIRYISTTQRIAPEGDLGDVALGHFHVDSLGLLVDARQQLPPPPLICHRSLHLERKMAAYAG
eukprot:1755783-Rhodomonas_salina.1